MVDLKAGENFGFLGFDFRRVRSRQGRWRPNYAPQMKKRTALLRKLSHIFREHRSQPLEEIVALINPILRGWVGYFAIGHSSRCFSYVEAWVLRKMRRHLMRARQRQGFGWNRWSDSWLYERYGVHRDYRIRYPQRSTLQVGLHQVP